MQEVALHYTAQETGNSKGSREAVFSLKILVIRIGIGGGGRAGS